jgi:ribosomal-protein-alanine N-acetyltransferase
VTVTEGTPATDATDLGGGPLFAFEAFPVLTTERLVLRELVPEDAPDLFRFRSDAEEQRFNSEPLRTVAAALALIEELRTGYAAGQQVQWGVTLAGEGRVVGLMGINSWERGHRRAEIGYDLARPLWGRGLAGEAVAAIVRFGFERLRLNRIEAFTIADNVRSVRMLERLGFRREGLRRELTLEDDGLFHDGTIYGLLRREYAPSPGSAPGGAAG